MKDETKGRLIFWGIVIAIFTLMFGSMAQFALSFERTIIKGKVINIEIYDDYMTVTFDNNETYNLGYIEGEVVDFTVNSELIVRLQTDSPWFMPNNDNIWYVETVIQVPVENP